MNELIEKESVVIENMIYEIRGVQVVLFSDVAKLYKYESQYNNIMFINNNSFHDRFIILDRNKLYSCGASFKDLGKKCFAINEFNDKEYLIRLLKILN